MLLGFRVRKVAAESKQCGRRLVNFAANMEVELGFVEVIMERLVGNRSDSGYSRKGFYVNRGEKVIQM